MSPTAATLQLAFLCSVGASFAACGDDSDAGETSEDVGTTDAGDTADRGDAAPDLGDTADPGDSDPVNDVANPDTGADTSDDAAPDVASDTPDESGADTAITDNDDDGVPAELDCDDNDELVTTTNVDADGDGFTGCDGDCCDSDDVCAAPALVNPAAVERGTDAGSAPVDDNCDGAIDEATDPCDTGIFVMEEDATTAAQALELCSPSVGRLPGLVAARWVRADGRDAEHSTQYGVSPRFGDTIVPQAGETMLVLSTGRARDRSQPGYCGSVTCIGVGVGTAPPGFPQEVPGCPGSTTITDDAGFELTLRAPSNATGFQLDVKYLTQDYPESVCTAFTDQAVMLLTPAPAGSIVGNIAFDTTGVPLSGDFSPTDICEGCALGDAELTGTGFDVPSGGSATTWQRVQAPVSPGTTFTLRIVIWDSGDQNFDSTLLVDNFAWTFAPTVVSTTTAPP